MLPPMTVEMGRTYMVPDMCFLLGDKKSCSLVTLQRSYICLGQARLALKTGAACEQIPIMHGAWRKIYFGNLLRKTRNIPAVIQMRE